MRALTATRSVHLIGGQHFDVATTEATAVRIHGEPTPVLRCVLPDGTERIVLRAAVVAYEGVVGDDPDSERAWY